MNMNFHGEKLFHEYVSLRNLLHEYVYEKFMIMGKSTGDRV